MSQELKLADSVWHRVIQLVQQAMLTGIDASDLMRQVRVTTDETDPNTLVLTADYQKQVKAELDKMLEDVETLQASDKVKNNIIIGGGGSGGVGSGERN